MLAMELGNIKIIGTCIIDIIGCLSSHTVNKNLFIIKTMQHYFGNLSI